MADFRVPEKGKEPKQSAIVDLNFRPRAIINSGDRYGRASASKQFWFGE
jgi:hypothetical protein